MSPTETGAPPVSLEDFASINAALEVGLPRDEILKEAGLTPASWEAAQEHWLRTLADQAAQGQLRTSRRYLALQGAQQPALEARARKRRRVLVGQLPVAPAPRITRRLTRTDGTSVPTGLLEKRNVPPFAAPSPPPLVEPGPAPAPPPFARERRVDRESTGVINLAVLAQHARPLPFAGGGDEEPEPVTPRAARVDSALPFAAPPAASTVALPFGAPAAPAAGLPFSGAAASLAALPFSAPAVGLPFSAPAAPAAARLPFSAPAAPGAVGLPFSAPAAPAAAGLPFSAPAAPVAARLPFSAPAAPAPRAEAGLPVGATTDPSQRAQPDDDDLPFSTTADLSQMAPPRVEAVLPFPAPAARPRRAPAPTLMDTSSLPRAPEVALPFVRVPGAGAAPPPRSPLAATGGLPFAAPVVISASPTDTAPPQRSPLAVAGGLPFAAPVVTSTSPTDTAPPQRSPLAATGGLPFQRPAVASQPPPAPVAPQPPAAPHAPVAPQHQARPAPEAPRAAPYDRFSLADYANLCAGVRAFPTHVPWIQSQFGLAPESWTALHALWQQRFQHDPALKAEWQRLIAERVPYWKRGG
jgi:hypothetical protein